LSGSSAFGRWHAGDHGLTTAWLDVLANGFAMSGRVDAAAPPRDNVISDRCKTTVAGKSVRELSDLTGIA
jgi:hypothetical protein